MADHQASLDRVFHALGDPTRRGIVERLVQAPASVGRLAEPVGMSLPAVMQHLQVLQDCGLITTRKVGRVRTCSVETDVLRRAESWLAAQRTVWESALDRLGEHLADPAEPPRGRPSHHPPASGRTPS